MWSNIQQPISSMQRNRIILTSNLWAQSPRVRLSIYCCFHHHHHRIAYAVHRAARFMSYLRWSTSELCSAATASRAQNSKRKFVNAKYWISSFSFLFFSTQKKKRRKMEMKMFSVCSMHVCDWRDVFRCENRPKHEIPPKLNMYEMAIGKQASRIGIDIQFIIIMLALVGPSSIRFGFICNAVQLVLGLFC